MEKQELDSQVQELISRCAMTEKRETERREADDKKHQEEVERVKRTNDTLKGTLEALLSAPNS